MRKILPRRARCRGEPRSRRARFDEGAPELLASIPRFAKAVESRASSLPPGARASTFAAAPLAYERGYGFLRDKVPLLSGLAAVMPFSFLFATWAELRALGQERATLGAALSSVTKDVFGESTTDPRARRSCSTRARWPADEDPLPHADAFDVMVQLSRQCPRTSPTTSRSSTCSAATSPCTASSRAFRSAADRDPAQDVRCFQDVKIVRTNQELGCGPQKYAMELDIKCPVEGKETRTAAPEPLAAQLELGR